MCICFGNSKPKPIDYGKFLKSKAFGSDLESSKDTLMKKVLISKETDPKDYKYTSVGPTAVAKAQKNATSTSLTSVQNKSKEDSIKKTIYKDTKGYKYDHEESTLSLAYSSFQHKIDFIENYDGKNQRRTIYEVIYELHLKEERHSLKNSSYCVKKMLILH